jgi:hypothetical protein
MLRSVLVLLLLSTTIAENEEDVIARVSVGTTENDVDKIERWRDENDPVVFTTSPASGPAILAALEGRCVSTADDAYEICVFRNVTQRGDIAGERRLLGLWRHWLSSSPASSSMMMYYFDGEECPGGLRRNVTVALECGARKLALAPFEEPQMCRYTSVLKVPISCDILLPPKDDNSDSSSDLGRYLKAERENPQFPMCLSISDGLANCITRHDVVQVVRDVADDERQVHSAIRRTEENVIE